MIQQRPIIKGYRGNRIALSTHVCGCCGASVTQEINSKTNPNINNHGIRVINGLVGKEISDEFKDISHVKTKNGNLTICIKKKFK